MVKYINPELNNSIEKLYLQINELSAKRLYAFTTDENNKILQETVNNI
jgi:hypothetical protein